MNNQSINRFTENQRDKYVRRFNMRQTDGAFVILFDGKEFIRVTKTHPMPCSFAFKIAFVAFLYCIGKRTSVWDELAVDPLKDVKYMNTVPRGLRNVEAPYKHHRRPINENKLAQMDIEDVLDLQGTA